MPINYYARKKTILGKKEVTYGTDPTPAPATDAVRTLDFSIEPFNAEAVATNEDKPEPGNDVSVLVGRSVRCSFGVFLASAGTAGDLPAHDFLLAGVGYEGDNVTDPAIAKYTQVFPVTDSITFYVDLDGKLHKFTGARGSLEIVSEKRSFPRMNFSFIGKFEPVAASAIDTSLVDKSAWLKALPFRASTVDISFFGQTVAAHSLRVTSGEDVQFRETSAEETIEVQDRAGTFQLRFDEPAIGTYDFWDDIDSENTGALNYTIGTVAGEIVEVNCLKTQMLQIGNPDEQGGLALDVSGNVIADSSNSFKPVELIFR